MIKRIVVIFIIILFLFPFYLKANNSFIDFKQKNGIDENEHIFNDNNLTVTAQNGCSITINKITDAYSDSIREVYTKSLPLNKEPLLFLPNGKYFIPEYESYYVILCKDGTHILHKFNADKNYLQKYHNDIKLSLKYEFENISLYNFTYVSDIENNTVDNVMLWIDNNSKYCGSFKSLPVSIYEENEDVKLEYYNYIKDIYFYITEEEIERCSKLLENDANYSINNDIYLATSLICDCDEEQNLGLFEKLNVLQEHENQIVNYKLFASIRMDIYTLPITTSKSIFELSETDAKKFSTIDPGISGELPINEEELAKFLSWKISAFQIIDEHTDDALFDSLNMPIKFELIPEGLKATSAGPDKEIGTDDDIVFVRTYESVGMKPLN